MVTLLVGLLGSVILPMIATSVHGMPRWRMLNLSPSVPRGLFWLQPPNPLQRGMLVMLPVPEAAQALVETQGWMPRGVPLLKPVVGADRGDAARQPHWRAGDDE